MLLVRQLLLLVDHANTYKHGSSHVTRCLQQAGLSVSPDMVDQPLNTVDWRYHVIKGAYIHKGIQKGLQGTLIGYLLKVKAVTIFRCLLAPYTLTVCRGDFIDENRCYISPSKHLGTATF